MRLIDADELFGELCDHLEEDEDTERAWVDIEAIVQALNHAPTVDAIPVEWLIEQEGNVLNGDDFRDECAGVRLAWTQGRKTE